MFLVRDTFTKELFAMKVLNTGSPELKTYAQQELHVLRDLGPKSPGLLSLIDTFNSVGSLSSFDSLFLLSAFRLNLDLY